MNENTPVNCNNCIHFDQRTHFCRKAPPKPVVFYDPKIKENKVSSKFPVITLPELDYCSEFEEAKISTKQLLVEKTEAAPGKEINGNK